MTRHQQSRPWSLWWGLTVLALLLGLGTGTTAGQPSSPAWQSMQRAAIDAVQQGRLGEAERRLRDVLASLDGSIPDDRLARASTLAMLGLVTKQQGRTNEAEAHYIEALAATAAVLGARHHDLSAIHFNLGVLYADTQRYDEAAAQFRSALEVLEGAVAAHDYKLALPLFRLGDTLRLQGAHDAAEGPLRRALAIQERHRGPGHADVEATRQRLALLADARVGPSRAGAPR